MSEPSDNKFPDAVEGYYGSFGGAYIPEILEENIRNLKENWSSICLSSDFVKEYESLLNQYVGRPTPMYHAKGLSELYKTHIFLKREDLCHTGAHKINNATGQILLAEKLNKKRIVAETGAGQHGIATASVCAMRGLECVIYMGAEDMIRQSLNVKRMSMMGAKVISVNSGSKSLKDATNEALRDWINHPNDTHYVIGSVVGPAPYPEMVAHFQSVIGHEILRQLSQPPDHMIACVGGGSNAIGSFYPFLNNPEVRLIGAEAAGKGLKDPQTPATLSKGQVGVFHGSRSYILQNQHGQIQSTHSLSAGLDYPGVGPIHAYLKEEGLVNYLSIQNHEALAAARILCNKEGILPALESAHALAVLEKESFSPTETIVICLSGRGDKDMMAYQKHGF
ncbi:MAG: tryptophan synthase subunit beta [Cytophagales bacterium]|nr:tryptophan synthase subunit beta [Cytophagales bacterium]